MKVGQIWSDEAGKGWRVTDYGADYIVHCWTLVPIKNRGGAGSMWMWITRHAPDTYAPSGWKLIEDVP